ncbi:Alpha/Beta hydrolase protein, partial [Gautieria morchelliformis]
FLIPGGGFVMPLHKGHLTLLNYFRREITRRSTVEVKAAFLEYTLSPIAIYPIQYRQAVLAIQHILNSGISPADILICGDSAGGMLALQIISYYLHPHPSIPASPMPQTPFAGILLISPWVVFDTNAPSFVNDRDGISPAVIRAWGKLFLPENVPADNKDSDSREEYWREPLKAPQAWWHGTEKVTKHMMFLSSEREVLRDDILSMVEQVRAGVAEGKVDITAVEYPGGLHINSIVDAFLARPPHDVTRMMAGWVHDRLIV